MSRKKSGFCATLVVCMIITCSTGARADVMPESSLSPMARDFSFNFHQVHDRGVYARASLGLGYVSDKIVPGVSEAEDESSGARVLSSAHVGGFVVPRLALHLSHFGQLGADRGALGIGAGVTFYPVEESNWMLSLSLGATSVYDAAPDVVFGEQMGLGGEAEVGTGWWVGARTSLGLSAVAGAHAFDLDGDRLASSGWHVGLRVSVSLN